MTAVRVLSHIENGGKHSAITVFPVYTLSGSLLFSAFQSRITEQKNLLEFVMEDSDLSSDDEIQFSESDDDISDSDSDDEIHSGSDSDLNGKKVTSAYEFF